MAEMQVIACYSNKGGVGKTAAAVNLALLAARSGRRTLLCDLDPQGASGFYFRVKPSEKLGKKRFFTSASRVSDAIRESDFPNLDILPANMSFRNFDSFLGALKNRGSLLKKVLKSAGRGYDLVVLDCPPNISILSENVFRVADRIVVPVVPTTLSERTLEQLHAFFDKHDLSRKKLLPFFSMVQARKSLHTQTILRLRTESTRTFLLTQIPFSTAVERMGLHRVPVVASQPRSPAAQSYVGLWHEIERKLA